MPELPEVETIKESLQGIVGLTIENIDIIRPDYIRLWENQPADYMVNKSAITRRGYLIFETTGQLYLPAHLGMSGRIYFEPWVKGKARPCSAGTQQ